MATLLVLILGLGFGSLSGVRDALGFNQTNSEPSVQQSSSSYVKSVNNSAYDSGWIALGVRPDPINIDINHGLGGDADDYLVSLECRDDTSLGTYDCTSMGFNVRALWFGLTNSMIHVDVGSGSQPDDVRVRIFNETPAYDSGWEPLGIRPDPINVNFNHGLGGNPNHYQVDLECKDDTSLGTYDCTDMGFNINAFLYGLNNTAVTVYAVGGSRPDDVRVRIYTKTPTYDSGWIPLGARPDPINVDLYHWLGGDPEKYRVSLECWDNTSLETYDCTNMGFNVDALWYGLTDALVRVEVVGGTKPDYVHVRIWSDKFIYLPLVIRE
ncbi:MAG: hypothetical protein PVG14_18785 [Anaerolineales bacterium]